jgi:uncharacterized membrane protein
MSDAAEVLAFFTAIGAGVVAGVFFAFSTFVMPALRRVPASTGIVAMQAINRAAPNPLFMLALMGTGATSVALCVATITDLGDGASLLAFVGGAVYLVVIMLTAAFHVPRNNALDGVDADGSSAAGAWNRYLREWVPANHVRTVAALAAATVLTVALTTE